jgi:hypothetical protein
MLSDKALGCAEIEYSARRPIVAKSALLMTFRPVFKLHLQTFGMDTIDVLRGSLALIILIIAAAVVAAIVVLVRSIARHGGAIVKTINRIMPSKTANLTKRGRV